MQLRKELEPEEISQEKRKNIIEEKIKKIEELIWQGRVKKEVEELNDYTGRDFDEIFFHETWSLTNRETIVEIAARRPPSKVDDITKEELIEIVKRTYGKEYEEWEHNYYLRLFEVNIPHPGGSDLIFWPEDNQNPTPEEIVNKALSYKRIAVKKPKQNSE